MRTRSTSKKNNNDNNYTNYKYDDFVIEIKTMKMPNDIKEKGNFLKRKRIANDFNIYFNDEKKYVNKYSNKEAKDLKFPSKNISTAKYNLNKFDILNPTRDEHHPKIISEVFNENFVDSLMYSSHENAPGSGLKNIGNTCFLNSVLQCVLYTVPLKNYLNYSEHSQMCNIKGVCFICEFGRLSKLVGKKIKRILYK